jgi:septal ring factor EnvC (AmiA/AmiB activator)
MRRFFLVSHASARGLIATLACASACVLAPFAPGPAHAQSAAEKELRRLESERQAREAKVGALTKDADRAAGEVVALRRRLVAAAEARDALERDVERSEVRLRRLRAEERKASAKLEADRDALEDVIVALIAVERDRPPALAVRPQNAADAARAAILMGEVAPILEGRAREIAIEIRRLRETREAILMQDRRYREANIRLQTARTTIGGLIAERRMVEARLRRDAETERQRIAGIVRRSADLRELVARLGGNLPGVDEAAPATGPAFSSDFAQALGRLPPPAAGTIASAYGARMEGGARTTGLTFRTRHAAQVTSPHDGRIEFAGPFRTYGRVLIVNVGGGYHLVLAGLGATFVEAGQEVLAGEPIGEMPGDARIVPNLYMEVRQAGETRDPALWLRRQNGT